MEYTPRATEANETPEALSKVIQLLPDWEPLISSITVTDDGHWVARSQYVTVANGQRSTNSRRTLWELFRGLVPDGYGVFNQCRKKHCIRPSHQKALFSKAPKFSREQVQEMTRLRNLGVAWTVIARKFETTRQTVAALVGAHSNRVD